MWKRIALAASMALNLHGTCAAADDLLPAVELYVPGVCLACIDWADHLRHNGFTVTLHDTPDMASLKRRLKVPPAAESVLTATVAGYFIEGHVPAGDIRQLLREKPKARGLAVPGLPRGAPGFETSNPFCETGCTILDNADGIRDARREPYETLLVAPDGQTSVWAKH